MVRAMDHRLNALLSESAEGKKRAENRVDRLTEQGLTLTRAFYNMLVDYEQGDLSFNQFVPIMLRELPAYEQ
jgi:hypothetical protein